MIRKALAGILLATVAVAAIAPAVSAAHSGDVVSRLVRINDRTHQFDTLIKAATVCTDVVDVLGSASGYTLFAPTDRAFRRAGLRPSNICDVPSAALAEILAYHVYADGVVGYRQALRLRGNSIPMLNGALFPATTNDTTARLSGYRWFLKIDGARVVVPNIRASNGIIHVVNRILDPRT